MVTSPFALTLRSGGLFLAGSLLLGHSERGSGGRESEELAQVLNTLVIEDVVVPAPAELGGDKVPGSQRLEKHEDLEVLNLSIVVFLLGEILLDDHDSIIEQLSVYRAAVLTTNEHHL